MVTETSIVNIALRRLGLEAIENLSDENNRAEVMNDLYHQVRKATLEEFLWPFAIKRKSLCLDAGEIPAFEYTKAHELPCDYIRAISEFDDNTYVREGEFILSDSDTIKLKYISDVTDPTKFNPLFTKVFYLMLSMEASYSLVQDKALLKGLSEEIILAFSSARVHASQESTPIDYEINDFLNPRF